MILCLLLLAGCGNAPAPVTVPGNPVSRGGQPQSDVPKPPSKPIGEMTWAGTDGKPTRLADLKGKAVILDFWATYCPPCIEEIPHLNELQAKYGADKLQVVGLNVGGPEDRPKIPAFAKQLKISYPIAFPEDALLSFVTGDDDRIPQTAVFDRDGKLIIRIIGFDESIRRELDAAVETAVGPSR